MKSFTLEDNKLYFKPFGFMPLPGPQLLNDIDPGFNYKKINTSGGLPAK
jgi:hypothetical protein